jgi:benzoyl-CoA reductase/2-hydroxyglutaryl-CoA dehydratase subunit BcrC/BadD/HgdB
MRLRKSSLSEKPRRQHSRRLGDWLKLAGAKKVHSSVDKVYKMKNLEVAWGKVRQNKGAGGIDEQSIEAFEEKLTKNLSARTAIIIEACKRLSVDGVLGKFHVGCRTGVGDAVIIKNAIRRELGIPVLLLEWEGFETRVFNEKQYKRRIELFRDTLNSSRHR